MSLFNIKEINKNKLLTNLEEINSYLKHEKQVCAMVKANAYGHGLKEICSILKGKVTYFGVANTDEASIIRSFDSQTKILVIGICDDFGFCIKNDVEFTIESLNSFIRLKKYLHNYKHINVPRIHIKINSGMNRIGINNNSDFINIINECQKFNIEISGIFTHFATPNLDLSFYNEQVNMFESFLNIIPLDIKPTIHYGGTSVIINNISKCDMIRIGIGLYGYECNEISDKIEPVMKIYSHIIQINDVKKGDRIGYSNGYICKKDMKIGVIPLGYGDGFGRWLKNRGYVMFKNRKCRIIANVCMDMFMVDLTDANAKLYDRIIIFEDADVWKKYNKTISYEIITNFSKFRGVTIVK